MSKFFVVIVLILFGSSSAQAEDLPVKIPEWAKEKVDCSFYLGITPQKKIEINDLSEKNQKLRNEYKAKMQRHLKSVLNGVNHTDVTLDVCYVLQYAEIGSFSETEIGITALEIGRLQVRGFLSQVESLKELAASNEIWWKESPEIAESSKMLPGYVLLDFAETVNVKAVALQNKLKKFQN